MCVKFHSEDLNLSSYPSHLTSTKLNTCGVTIALRVRGGN